MKKGKVWLFLGILIAAACSVWLSGFQKQAWISQWEMKKPLMFDETLKKNMEELSDAGIDAMLWKENKSDIVTNADYNRSIEVKTMGVLGDASVLFPNSNRLAAGEGGYCLLGEDTAVRLFGTTRVTGRSVQVNGVCYHVAGIEYQEKELCVYELPPDEDGITHAAIRSQSRGQMEMDKRRLSYLLAGE